MKAVSTSLAVTAGSLRIAARCSNSQSMSSVSEAEGSSRGLTMPVRDSVSHIANTATTMATRVALTANVPAIVAASEPGRNRRELGRENFLRRRKILHAAHERQRAIQRVERLLHHMRLLLRVFVGRDPAGREVGRRILGVIEDGARFA